MFNERGIEYVGLRELAALLHMRVSNITYYFPTKDDLVYELALQLSRVNSETIIRAEKLTLQDFLAMFHQVFINQLRFRCLFLSFVHLMEQNKRIAEAYKHTQNVRNSTIRANLEVLSRQGYLDLSPEQLDFVVATLALISRFWISEAAISSRQLPPEAQIRHYLLLLTGLLLPYASPEAKEEIWRFSESLREK